MAVISALLTVMNPVVHCLLFTTSLAHICVKMSFREAVHHSLGSRYLRKAIMELRNEDAIGFLDLLQSVGRVYRLASLG